MKSNRLISLRVIGGFLDGLTLVFDTGLTCIIGARGTGKSTILELIRYCLDQLPKKDLSPAARRRVENLVAGNLGGGRVELEVENSDGVRYQLIIGKPHPVTAAIARMHPDDQDAIDDFLLEAARSGFSLRGQFLSRLIQQAIHGTTSPTEQQVAELVPTELLKMARRWQRGELKLEQVCQRAL